jgi:hypothetical protein
MAGCVRLNGSFTATSSTSDKAGDTRPRRACANVADVEANAERWWPRVVVSLVGQLLAKGAVKVENHLPSDGNPLVDDVG